MVRLDEFARRRGVEVHLYAKLESFNPGGSAKDRVALQMIIDAERKGTLCPGGTIIEPTSGNTGVGLALVGAVRGYRVILTMPDTMSVERRKLAAAYGAEIVLTPGALGMKGAIAEANRLQSEIEGAVILQQFENRSNPLAHEKTTGVEIVADCKEIGIQVDALVAGVGTGGTLSGAGKVVKQAYPSAKVVGVEPADSAVLNGKPAGAHLLQGIGAGFVPANYDASVVDEVLMVENEQALQTARALAKEEGLLVGISSGAAVNGALQLAARPAYAGKHIVVVLPDTGERYLSTCLFSE